LSFKVPPSRLFMSLYLYVQLFLRKRENLRR